MDFRIEDRLPRSVTSLKDYDGREFAADVLAGVAVGLVALLLAMALTIASDVRHSRGLYCGIVAGFLMSALGGSRTQIGGPTGGSTASTVEPH